MTRLCCRVCRRPPPEPPKEAVEVPKPLIAQVEVTTTQPDIANVITRAEESARMRHTTSGAAEQAFYSPLSSAQVVQSNSSPEPPLVAPKEPTPPSMPSEPQRWGRVVDQARAYEQANAAQQASLVSPPPTPDGASQQESQNFTGPPHVRVRPPTPVQQETKESPPELALPSPQESGIEEEIPITARTPAYVYEASPRLLPVRTGSKNGERSEGTRRKATRLFVEAWLTLLELGATDVSAWVKEESLVRAHILQRLVTQDVRCTLELLDSLEDTLTPSSRGMLDIWAQHRVGCESSIIHTVADDHALEQSQEASSVPLVLSLFPVEVLNEVPVFTRAFNDRYLDAFDADERAVNRERLQTLRKTLEDTPETEMLDTRWSYFSQLMSSFGLNDKFNFEIHMNSLLTPTSAEKWATIVTEIASAIHTNETTAPPGDLVRVQSSTRMPTGSPGTSPDPHSTGAVFSTPLKEDSDAEAHHVERRRRSSLRRQLTRIKRSRLLHYRRAQHGSKVYHSIHGESGAWSEEQKKGVLIAYKMVGDGMVACKVRSRLRLPFVNAMVTLDDFDSFTSWVPYCIKADKLTQFSNACYLLSYIADLPWPIRKRETLALAGCVECLNETGQMIVYVMTLAPETKEIMGYPIPKENPKIPRIRSYIGFFVRPLSMDETALEIRAIMEPGVQSKMLRGIIPWVVKNTVVDFFSKIATLANKVNMEEFRKRNHPHQHFYDSMEERVKKYLDEHGSLPLDEEVTTPRALLSAMSGGAAPSPGGTIQNKGSTVLFDESDLLWFTRLPSFKPQ